MSSGYVDFPTLPAGAGSTSVPGLGTFSTLAGPAGVWSPVVGPKGKGYAMAANILFIFPGPRIVPIRDVPIGDAPAVALG